MFTRDGIITKEMVLFARILFLEQPPSPGVHISQPFPCEQEIKVFDLIYKHIEQSYKNYSTSIEVKIDVNFPLKVSQEDERILNSNNHLTLRKGFALKLRISEKRILIAAINSVRDLISQFECYNGPLVEEKHNFDFSSLFFIGVGIATSIVFLYIRLKLKPSIKKD